ncbi:MAG: type II toxin-antitoxin system RelE/ParE family toxin [Verrucomicrobia bacterium]|nr:type II toxin-antitoxin system RelE/ParE family toxin [Verrucomicrobiota bacterium]
MKWRVVFFRSAEKELSSLSSEGQVRVGRAIRRLETEPVPAASKRLRGREEFRLRVGDYRILYVLDAGNKIVKISAIGHRRDIY